MLDSTGEVVLESGVRDEKLHLVGAYQGIALSQLERSSALHGGGAVRELWSRYAHGYVLMRPLKDGYYLVLVLGPEGSIAVGRHFMRPAQAKMTQEL